MNRHTGTTIDGDAQLAQDINDLFSTPVGTRVMRRAYGSLLPSLLDQPLNGETQLLVCAAAAGAINRWIRRIRVVACRLTGNAEGKGLLTIDFRRTDTINAQPASLAIPL